MGTGTSYHIGRKHGFLLLALSEVKMLPDAGNRNLDCERIKKLELLNPIIKDITQVR